ncbi:MAG: type II toxin-antitoxin system HicA family toxin [Candidatus Omnitrophica bacterium]|nr:type II toxin-antitoxin system HicA family toxin [Candidatus Omnitrophota bacterium]
MGGLAPVHYTTLEKFVRAAGSTFVRQTSSHRVYWRDDQVRPIIIPTYKQVPVFIIRNILRQLKIAPEEYLRMLQNL